MRQCVTGVTPRTAPSSLECLGQTLGEHMNKTIATVTAAAVILTGCAATGYRATPNALDDQTVRYDLGAPTVSQHSEQISLSVLPVGAGPDRRLIFDVAVINRGEEAFNFGVENLQLTIDGSPVSFFTHDELVAQAERERNAQIAAAIILGAAAAYSASQARSTGHSTYSSPYGVSTYSYSYTDPTAAMLGSAMAGAVTAATVNAANENMQDTLRGLGQSALRTTTVDPGYSFGGRSIAQPIELEDEQTAEAVLTVEAGGETTRFHFDVSVGEGIRPEYGPAPRAGVTGAKALRYIVTPK